MDTLLQDLRYSARLLLKTPGFTAVAVMVLALGIGANTAIFSIVRELTFGPRPFPDEEQIVQFYTQDKVRPETFVGFSFPTFSEIREQGSVQSVFSDLLAHNLAMVSLGEAEFSRRTAVAVVSSNYFRTLKVSLVQGREFSPDEERPGRASQVVIASYVYWKKMRFDPNLVGSVVRINERPFIVVGITPKDFTGTMMLFGPEFYFPLGDYDFLVNGNANDTKDGFADRDFYALNIVGRLKPGVSASSAEAVLKVVASNLEKEMPVDHKDKTFTLRLLPRLSQSTSPADESFPKLIGIVLCSLAVIVLFIACLNLANMLLARGVARRKEIAIRLALGGGGMRIVRQLITEGLVLSLLGGLVGFVIGYWSSDLIVASMGSLMPISISFRGCADPEIFAITLGFSALTTLFFALGPALKLVRGSLVADLKEQAGEDTAARRRRWLPRNPLVVVQVALSLGLLTTAGLFIRGALKASSIDTGFNAESTLLIDVDTTLTGMNQTHCLQTFREISNRVSTMPGVQAVSVASTVPFGLLTINRPVQRAGMNPGLDSHASTAAEGHAYNVRTTSIGADYFKVMGLPLLRGRVFTKSEAELEGAPAVAIIDEMLARKLWPDGDALGQRIQWATPEAPTTFLGGRGIGGMSNSIARQPGDPVSVEIVGIVPATRWELFTAEAGAHIYVPFAQGFKNNAYLQVRTAPRAPGADASVFGALRREIRSVAPGVLIFKIAGFRQHAESSTQLRVVRSGAILISVFGGLALILAVLGLYGVKAYAVARRTRELGIRMALGASPGDVLRLVLVEGLIMTFSGAALGLLIALGLGRMLSGMLYQVSPTDPLAFTAAPLVLIVTALVACWIPARRASKIAPLAALRTE